MKEKFLTFIDTTNHYETDRLFGLLPSDGMLLVSSAAGLVYSHQIRSV
jgi:hypothetical protein